VNLGCGLRLGEGGDLPEQTGGAGERAEVEPVELAADGRPGGVGGGLDDADQQQGEPAEDDMCAYAFLESVVDGPQVDDLFHVPPAPLDFEELLVTEGDVLGRQMRIGASQQVLAVEVLLSLDLGGVEAEFAGPGVVRR
jgi:hypothetical protein